MVEVKQERRGKESKKWKNITDIRNRDAERVNKEKNKRRKGGKEDVVKIFVNHILHN